MDTISETVCASLRQNLLGFFDARARNLPWRESADPYQVWISEIMLQQTRVDTAVPYYRRWMERFPTVDSLAAAPLDSVLEAWAGLGYYSRARNLHRAASIVREHHDGALPGDLDGLRALPGIGEYTAGAVASIAFGIATPAVDGNVRRVLSRLFDIENPTPGVLRSHASALVDPRRPGDFNQSLMELGATVCTPRAPRCEDCPVRQQCRAHKCGTVAQRPPTRPAKAIPRIDYAVAAIRFDHAGEVWTLLNRRPESGLLGGMLEFPTIQLEGPREGVEAVQRRAALVAGEIVATVTPTFPRTTRSLECVRHRFSHIAATYHAFVVDLGESPIPDASSDHIPIAWDALDTAALPAAQRKIAQSAARLEPRWRTS